LDLEPLVIVRIVQCVGKASVVVEVLGFEVEMEVVD
jgi:hypothetical protein